MSGVVAIAGRRWLARRVQRLCLAVARQALRIARRLERNAPRAF